MEDTKRPSLDLAIKTLPKGLLRALRHIFSQNLQGCTLVDGTALAGFYAGHRRSDDIDLFTSSPINFKAASLAVKSLSNIGAIFTNESLSQQYFHSLCSLDGHNFTIDVVEDKNLFMFGEFATLEGGISVPLLDTLFCQKAATLVSRCSEKDLFDLMWLFENLKGLTIGDLIIAGQKIDSGVNGENILASLSGAILRQEACNFAIAHGAKAKATVKTDNKNNAKIIYKSITLFRKNLIQNLSLYLRNKQPPPLGELVKFLKR